MKSVLKFHMSKMNLNQDIKEPNILEKLLMQILSKNLEIKSHH